MDLTEPARLLLPAGTAAVLRVLTGANGSFTMRQVARLAGVSPPVARQAIHRLANHGLVLTWSAGRSTLCKFNDEHLAAKPVQDLIHLRSKMLAMLSDTVVHWPVRPLHASLFGSAARGDGDTDSDLDILLIRPTMGETDVEVWDEQLVAAGEGVLLRTGNPAAWFDITNRELLDMAIREDPVVESWRRDSLLLIGPPLTDFLNAGNTAPS